MSLEERIGIVGVLPDYQFLDNFEQALSFLILLFFGREDFGPCRRIIDKRCKEHRTAGSQWTACPPEMQGGRMPMPDGFLSGRYFINRLQRERDFDMFLAVLRGCCHSSDFLRNRYFAGYSITSSFLTRVRSFSPGSISRSPAMSSRRRVVASGNFLISS